MPIKDEILNFLRELKPELESFGIYKGSIQQLRQRQSEYRREV